MQFLHTEKCKNTLLRPQSNVKELYKKLMVNVDNTEDTKPAQYYALAFLKASFISKTVLTDVFSRRSDNAETMVSAFKCVKTEI
ncbi:hypothetical protein AAC387_Pa12g1362 [Persea americana]